MGISSYDTGSSLTFTIESDGSAQQTVEYYNKLLQLKQAFENEGLEQTYQSISVPTSIPKDSKSMKWSIVLLDVASTVL